MIKMEKPGVLNVIVIDVDGAVVQQKRLMDQYQPTVIPLQKDGEALRYWCRFGKLEQLFNAGKDEIGKSATQRI
jgi:hypothetical protein